MSANVATVLDGAADVIMKCGWCQGQYEDSTGSVCVDGAIRCAASTGSPESRYTAAVDRAHKAMQRHVGIDNLPYWNDALDRTADEVITALRACAAVERARNVS